MAFDPTPAAPAPDPTSDAARGRRRLRGLLNHFILFFAALVVLVPINFLTTPQVLWFPWVLVAWGTPLALHVAYVMGLFGGGSGGTPGR